MRQIRSIVQLSLGGLLVLTLLGGMDAFAQSGAGSVESISMGGATSVFSAPTAALYTNPANLQGGESDPGVEVRLFDLRAYSGGNLLQFHHYNETFTGGQSLSPSEVTQTLDSWFGSNQRRGVASLEVTPISFTYQPDGKQWAIGGGLRMRNLATTSLNRGLFDLLLKGTETERVVPLDGRYRTAQTVDVTGAFSYAFESMPLSVGVAPRIIFGTSYADGVLDSQVTIAENELVHQFDYTARAAGMLSSGVYDVFDAFRANPLQNSSFQYRGEVVGIGGSVDLGATYEVEPGLFVGLSVTDLGGVRWAGGAQTVTPQHNEFRFEGVDLNLRRLRNEFNGSVSDYLRHQVDSLARAAYRDVNRDRSPFVTGLPTSMQLNGTWDRGQLTVTGGTSIGFNRAAGAVSSIPTLHAGGEYRVVGILPLRAGVRLLGTKAATFAGGFGIDLGGYRFDLGASVTPKTSFLGSGAHYAVGLSMATVRF